MRTTILILERSRRAALLVLGGLAIASVGLAGNVWAGPKTKVPDAPYPDEFRSRVRKAIDGAVNYLRTKQLADRRAPVRDLIKDRVDDIAYDEAAAVTWVLRRAGLPSGDEALAKAAKTFRARPPKNIEQASLLLLALCAESLPDGNPFAIEELAAPSAPTTELAPDDQSLIQSTAKFILDRQVTDSFAAVAGRAYDGTGGWGFEMPGGQRDDSDIPTTYLALLGLEAASRRGVQIPATTHLAALRLLVGWQATKGPATTVKMNEVRGRDRFEWTEKAHARGFGWAGGLSDKSTSGYETAAGAIGLAICQDALQKEPKFSKDLREQTRAGIRDALAWLQRNYDVTRNPVLGPSSKEDIAGPLFHHHWFQGLARLGVHARMRFYGSHDWYREGAEELMKAQRPDGSWDAIWWSNCYAILFLQRASLRSTAPVLTVESDASK